MTPSIVVDLMMRDLTATTVDGAAANARAKLSAAVGGGTATTGSGSTKKSPTARFLSEEEEAEAKLGKFRRQQRVNELMHANATAAERDKMFKRLGRTPYTIEHPFESLVTKEGVQNRFSSLFAGQVGTLLVYGTALKAASAAVTGFVTANVELEDSLAKVNTVLTGSASEQEAQYTRLREQAISWGKTHAQSAKDAADAMYYLISAGQSVQDVQRNLPAVLNLAYGGFLEAGFAAETAATAYALFAKRGLSMVDIVDKIQKTANVSQVTVQQYANAFQYLASTAELANISFDEVNAAIGTLGTLGLRGSKGGRNLDEALGQILKKQSLLKSMGIDIATASGELKSLDDILAAFREKIGSKIDVPEQKVLRDIFGQQGGRAFGLLIENTDLYRKTLVDVKDAEGQSLDAAMKRGNTLSQMYEQLTNKVKAFAQEGVGKTNWFSSATQGVLRDFGINLKADSLSSLLEGQQGSGGIRKALEKLRGETARNVYDVFGNLSEEVKAQLKARWGDQNIAKERVFTSLFGSDPTLERKAMEEFFGKMAIELAAGEQADRLRSKVEESLHVNMGGLQLFTFTEADVTAAAAKPKEFLEELQRQLTTQLLASDGIFGENTFVKAKLEAISKALSTQTGDVQFRPKTGRQYKDAELDIKSQEQRLKNLKDGVQAFHSGFQTIDEAFASTLRAQASALGITVEALVTNGDKLHGAGKFARFFVSPDDAEGILHGIESYKDAVGSLADDGGKLAALTAAKKAYQERLSIIDREFLLQEKKNRAEYKKSLDEIAKDTTLTADERKRMEGSAASLLGGQNRGAQIARDKAKFELRFDVEFGGRDILKLQQDVRRAKLALDKSLDSGDDSVGLSFYRKFKDRIVKTLVFPDVNRKMKLIDDELVISQQENSEKYQTALIDLQKQFHLFEKDFIGPQELPQEYLDRRAQLEGLLRLGNETDANEAFLKKDKMLRQDLIQTFEQQLSVERKLQELHLQERGVSAFPADTNAMMKRQLEGLARLPGSALGESASLQARKRIQDSIGGIDAKKFSSDDYQRLVDVLQELGPAAGYSDEQLNKMLETLNGAATTVDPFTAMLGATTDALLAMSGAMAQVGDNKTWSAIGSGIGSASAALEKFDKASSLFKAGSNFLGAMSVAGGVFGIVSAISSLVSLFDTVDAKQNTIGVEDYKYTAGKNVSPSYGKATTINVQVDMAPNFNFLDATQLSMQRQRDIAFTLGDETVEYLQDNGWLPRR